MPSTLFISTSQIYTLIYLFAHLCYAASMVFFFSRTLSPRFFVRKPFLCSLPFLGILLLYTGITGDAQSPFFKIVFYCVALAANGLLYGTRFWRRMGNYFFIVICLGIVEFVATILYYPLIFLFHREIPSWILLFRGIILWICWCLSVCPSWCRYFLCLFSSGSGRRPFSISI